MEKQYELAWQSGLFLVVCLVLFFIAKLIFSVFNRSVKINHELTVKDNLAFYLDYTGYFMGVLMVIGGIMMSEGTSGFWDELFYAVAYGMVGMVMLNVGAFILDKAMHPQLSLTEEITNKNNIAIGILKGANYLGTGVIISGVMLAEVDKPIALFAFLGVALLISSLGVLYYNLITPFDIKKTIYEGNIAVAISTSGAQVAFAMLIYAGFQIDHSTWINSLTTIGIDVLVGFLIIPIIRLAVDKLFLPGTRLTDELINQEEPNIGAGIFEAGAYVGGALLFVWCWNL